MMNIKCLTRSGTLENILGSTEFPELSTLHYDNRDTADSKITLREMVGLLVSRHFMLKDLKIIFEESEGLTTTLPFDVCFCFYI